MFLKPYLTFYNLTSIYDLEMTDENFRILQKKSFFRPPKRGVGSNLSLVGHIYYLFLIIYKSISIENWFCLNWTLLQLFQLIGICKCQIYQIRFIILIWSYLQISTQILRLSRRWTGLRDKYRFCKMYRGSHIRLSTGIGLLWIKLIKGLYGPL